MLGVLYVFVGEPLALFTIRVFSPTTRWCLWSCRRWSGECSRDGGVCLHRPDLCAGCRSGSPSYHGSRRLRFSCRHGRRQSFCVCWSTVAPGPVVASPFAKCTAGCGTYLVNEFKFFGGAFVPRIFFIIESNKNDRFSACV